MFTFNEWSLFATVKVHFQHPRWQLQLLACRWDRNIVAHTLVQTNVRSSYILALWLQLTRMKSLKKWWTVCLWRPGEALHYWIRWNVCVRSHFNYVLLWFGVFPSLPPLPLSSVRMMLPSPHYSPSRPFPWQPSVPLITVETGVEGSNEGRGSSSDWLRDRVVSLCVSFLLLLLPPSFTLIFMFPFSVFLFFCVHLFLSAFLHTIFLFSPLWVSSITRFAFLTPVLLTLVPLPHAFFPVLRFCCCSVSSPVFGCTTQTSCRLVPGVPPGHLELQCKRFRFTVSLSGWAAGFVTSLKTQQIKRKLWSIYRSMYFPLANKWWRRKTVFCPVFVS